MQSSSPSPHGVPLSDLGAALKPTMLKASRDGDILVVKHERLVTRVEVAAPQNPNGEDTKISAIVTIKTYLPRDFVNLHIDRPHLLSGINKMATLGAVTHDGDQFFVGSRLTVYEGEDAWNVHFGLMVFAVIAAADTLLGAAQRIFTQEAPRAAELSAWTQQDFQFVHSHLSRRSVCTLGGLGLTAEFGLRPGEGSAAALHLNTALWEMMGDQPHTEMGNGLLCLLNMPHMIDDKDKLNGVIGELNRLEMRGSDLPPHFGAWCLGKTDTNPAYVSFLPNALHQTDGIALDMSIWAMKRAQIANAMLLTMGVR